MNLNSHELYSNPNDSFNYNSRKQAAPFGQQNQQPPAADPKKALADNKRIVNEINNKFFKVRFDPSNKKDIPKIVQNLNNLDRYVSGLDTASMREDYQLLFKDMQFGIDQAVKELKSGRSLTQYLKFKRWCTEASEALLKNKPYKIHYRQFRVASQDSFSILPPSAYKQALLHMAHTLQKQAYGLMKVSYIEKAPNGTWGVYSHAGDLLGEHPTKEKALAQLRAIEISKSKQKQKK